MNELIGPLHTESYVHVNEVRGDAYGFRRRDPKRTLHRRQAGRCSEESCGRVRIMVLLGCRSAAKAAQRRRRDLRAGTGDPKHRQATLIGAIGAKPKQAVDSGEA